MALDRQSVCFTCSQPVAEPPAINQLENGETCPTCRDRLLDSLPPLLPSRALAPIKEEGSEEPYPYEPYEPSDEGYEPPPGA